MFWSVKLFPNKDKLLVCASGKFMVFSLFLVLCCCGKLQTTNYTLNAGKDYRRVQTHLKLFNISTHLYNIFQIITMFTRLDYQTLFSIVLFSSNLEKNISRGNYTL